MPALHAATRVARRIIDILLVAVIALVLAAVILARGIPFVTGGATYVIGGGSMEPTLPRGSAVVDLPVTPDRLAVGDVVTLQVGEHRAIFTHRIIRLVPRDDGLWLQTRGDANADADPSIVPATVVLGRVEATIPYAGFALVLLSSGQGVLFLLALAVVLLAGAWLLEGVELDQEVARRRAARARHALAGAASAATAATAASPGEGPGLEAAAG